MSSPYDKTIWVNDTTPPISADNLNKIEQGIYNNSVLIENTITDTAGTNLYDYTKNTDGYGYGSNGVYGVHQDQSVSEYIAVTPNTTYSAGYAANTTGPRVTMFTNNTGTLASTYNVSPAKPTTFTTGADVHFVRLSFALSSKATGMLVEGSSMPTTFIPYTINISLKSSVVVPQLDTIATNERTVNLFDKDNIEHAYYNANLAYKTDENYTISDFIEVGNNTKIITNRPCRYALFDSNQTITARSEAVSASASYDIPVNTSYIRMFMQYSSTEVINSTIICFGDKLPDDYVPYTQLVLNRDIVIPQIQNVLSDLTVNILGDSFTYMANDGASQWRWHRYITQRTGMTVNNYGVAGSCMVSYTETPYAPSFEDRYASMTDDCDCVVIFGGINDANGIYQDHYDIPYFKDHLADLIEGIIAKYPTKVIVALLPPNINPEGGFSNEINDVCEAEKEVYTAYGIPFLDLRSASTISTVTEHLELYNTALDNIHWNTDGHKRASFPIQKFLEDYLRAEV